ncbi:MAG: Rnase Y domain-containing protein, partial [bacterium]|nr:Rnase Y domain-containing protein [bacterium]
MSFFNNLSSLFGPQQGGRKNSAAAVKNKNLGPAVIPVAKKPQTATPIGQQAPPAYPVSPQPPARSAAPVAQVPMPRISAQEEQSLLREAQAKAREIIVEAKDEALAIRSKSERDARDANKQLEEQQRSLDVKLDRLEIRLTSMQQKEQDAENLRDQIIKQKAELETQKQKILDRLEKVSGLTKDEARQTLFEGLERQLSQEMAQFIRQKEEEARDEADEKVKEILVDSMKHGATDYVPEYTVSTVTLPSEEAKGKIIGKAGRNIHTFERYTGVDVDLDTSPTEVRLSCFDPVRREIARISLERLVKDGRIQPTRIEEVVDKVTSEIDKITFEAGKKLCHDVGVYNLPTDLMKMLGKFKYRFSYGQNLIAHTLE